MSERQDAGAVIGITDEGYIIVTESYSCPHWSRQGKGLADIHECWYCKYADFRKSTGIHISSSICRCPDNRVDIQSDFNKNEI